MLNPWSGWTQISLPVGKVLTTYMPQHLGRAFSGAHFEQLDSMIRYRKCHGVTFEERLCICGALAVEDIGHILFRL